MLIGDLLRRQAAPTGRPHKSALLYEGAAVTYAELEAQANRLARALLALGVHPGDRVALLGRNSPAWAAAYYAAAHAGAILVPLNFWYRTDEIAYVLGDSGARVCLLASPLAPVVAPLREQYSSVKRWVWLDTRPESNA